MTKKIKVSLSRGHKLVERITRVLNEISSEITTLVTPLQISVLSETSQIDSIVKNIETKLKLREELYTSLFQLRTAIAAKNSASKIPELLAKKAILTQRLASINGILSSSNSSTSFSRGMNSPILKNDFKTISEYFDRMKDADVLNNVKVAILSDELLKSFESEVKKTQNSIDFLSDEINDVNAKNKISLEFSDEVAQLLGIN